MINEKMRALGAVRSVIRELFEYGNKRRAVLGEDKVFDFSLGNPSVPSPDEVNESLIKIINKEPPTSLHAYTSAEGDLAVRQAISDYINSTYGESTTASCFYMTAGAAAALAATLTALASRVTRLSFLLPTSPNTRCLSSARARGLCPYPQRRIFPLT